MIEFLKESIHLWRMTGLWAFRFDLQLFAAEDEGRTEEPTEKKLREAREKGQVAKTMELPQAVVIIFGIMSVFMLSTWIYDSIASMTKHYLTTFSRFSLTEAKARIEFFSILWNTAKVCMPIFIAVVIAGILGNVIQVGFQFSTHPLKFDWNKIKFDPATIMKKVFFSKQIAMNLFKTIFKVCAISLIAYLIIMDDFETFLKTPDVSVAMATKIVMISALKVIIWSAVLILVLSIPDYIFQKREFIESLKMSKQELKEELKETIGDPYIRARLREMQREIVMRNMIREVPRADVVVTNPTHYAVALKYEREIMIAPTVIAKGIDSMAIKIRGIARENGIEIMENRPLAQDLYNRLDVGETIPEDLFAAVSLIYAELYRKNIYKEAI